MIVAMSLNCLPPELLDHILFLAVHNRGIKRALRLRLVNRLFSTIALEALFRSGLLDDGPNQSLRDEIIWRRYIAYRALSNTRPIPYELRILRRVAERITEHTRQAEGRVPGDKDVQNCVVRLCEISHVGRCVWRKNILNPQPEDAPRANDVVDENGDYFKKSLFSAAAYLNHVDLIQDLLSREEYTVHEMQAIEFPSRRKTEADIG
jgi:hypothetical protein